MNLIIDVGNTRVKIAIFDESQLIIKKVIKHDELQIPLLEQLGVDYNLKRCIFTDSGIIDKVVIDYLIEHFWAIHCDATTPIPLENRYATPTTLGKDRLAGAVAANYLFPKENCLFIDCGTCTTYNFVDAKNTFWGGSISPGIEMRLKAMQYFTAKLPLVARGNTLDLIGNDTTTALQTGAQIGAIGEMNGFIEAYIQRFGEIRTLLTGGDAAYFANRLKNEASINENLTLIGLNVILNFNFDNK